MAKDILLFGTMWQYNAMFFFDQIKEALEEEPEAEFVLRLNCEGGSPEYGMSIIERINELKDRFSIKVNAMAHSWGLFFLCYVDANKCEALDVTQALLHRAAYPSWIEKQDDFKGSVYEDILVKSNRDLEKAFRARVDVAVLEALPVMKDKNLTVKDIFSMEGRAEVILTGSDLKKIGLVGSVTKITPTKSAEIKAQHEIFKDCKSIEDFKIAAQLTAEKPEVKPAKKDEIVMTTLAELKEKFPALYAQAIAEGRAEGLKDGIAQEADRVGAVMVFAHLDPKGASEIIKSGKAMSATQQAEFLLKANSPAAIAALKADNEEPKPTTPVAKTPENLEFKAFEASLKADLGLTKTVHNGTVLVQEKMN